jgi:hypothetical protein
MVPPIVSVSQTQDRVKTSFNRVGSARLPAFVERTRMPGYLRGAWTVAELWDQGSVVMMVRNEWDRPS